MECKICGWKPSNKILKDFFKEKESQICTGCEVLMSTIKLTLKEHFPNFEDVYPTLLRKMSYQINKERK